MKLKRNDVITYSPRLVRTVGDSANDQHFSIGVVLKYDKDADCYDIDIGCENEFAVLTASIIPDDITKDNLKVIGTL
jgi:hypothetical protein